MSKILIARFKIILYKVIFRDIDGVCHPVAIRKEKYGDALKKLRVSIIV